MTLSLGEGAVPRGTAGEGRSAGVKSLSEFLA